MAKKKIVCAFALAILIMFLFDNVIASFYVPSENAAECSIHGDIAIDLQSVGVMYTKDLLVEAKYSSESSYSKVDGIWYDKEDNTLSFLQSDEKAVFRSSGSYFNKAGEYSIRVSYKDVHEEIRVTCPEFKFSCNDIKIDIQECYSEGDDFVIVFLGKGLESQKVSLDLEKDLYYKIESQRQSWFLDNLPINLSFDRLENETYKMTFPRNKEYPVEGNLLRMVEIGVKESINTIPYLGSGCNGGESNKVYPNARDLESKCPTKVEITPSDVEITPNKTKEIDKTDITGNIINGDENIQDSSAAPVIIAGIIGFIIGIAITFLWIDKKR